MKRARSRGQSIVESALILTAFMGLLLGTATVGESLFVREALADRARLAARWGALNPYNAATIRRVLLFGTEIPAPGQSPLFGLTPAAVEVSNPGCPGPDCRVLVAVPEHGIHCVEPRPMEPADSLTPGAVTPGPVASQP